MEGRNLKVEVVSAHTMKPSSATPLHLRHFKLSLLDQFLPDLYMPLVLFYSRKESDRVESIKMLDNLKRSLSETLTQYYPLAGRMKDGDTIECNDDGIHFVEARVACNLSDFLLTPEIEVLEQFLPRSIHGYGSELDVLLAVQITSFECGGVAIGVLLCHKMCDASSFCTFLNDWTAVARGANESIVARLVSDSIFPSKSLLQALPCDCNEKVVVKRLVFNRSALESIRDRATDETEEWRPTRYEAVAALIWRCMMRAQYDNEQPGRMSVVLEPVALRMRMKPPLPERYFGNLIYLGVTSGAVKSDHGAHMQRCLEMKLREVVRGLDSELIKDLQGPDGASKIHQGVKTAAERYMKYGLDVFFVTNVSRIPFYELDFGWGKPSWVSSSRITVKNLLSFFGTKSGDGMEAWICLEEEDMAKFQKDEELLSFVNIG